MNEYLEEVSSRLAHNKLSLNIDKTVYITFGNYCDSVPKNTNIYINNHEIKRVEYCKYLGLNIDYNMKWDRHIETIINKTKYLIYVFAKISNIVQTDVLALMYYALFHSIATYGIIAWGGAYRNSVDGLQRIQNKLTKIISKNRSLIRNQPLTLKQSFTYESVLYHFANLRDIYLNRITKTRFKTIPIPKITKTISNKNSYVEATRIYNELPSELKKLTASIGIIKCKIKNWIKSNK